MVKTLFQNSKAALIFAGLTIAGAVAMVGSQEDSGVLLEAVSVAEARANLKASAAQSGQAAPPPPSVFGEYKPQDPAGAAPNSGQAAGPASPAGSGEVFNPMKAPLASTAIVNPPETALPE